MADFQFRFESLLKYRKNHRDLRSQMLAQLFADDQTLIQHRKSIEEDRANQLVELGELGSSGIVDIDGAASRRYYAGQLLGDVMLVEHNRGLLAQQIQLSQQALTKADQEVKVLEKLREKQLAEFDYEDQRRTSRELEETWLATHLTETSR